MLSRPRASTCGLTIWSICAKSAASSLADILGRIEERLTAVSLSVNAAEQKAHKPGAIRNIRTGVKKGRQGVSMSTLDALAPVLQPTSRWLQSGEGAIVAVTSAEVKTRLAAAQAELRVFKDMVADLRRDRDA